MDLVVRWLANSASGICTTEWVSFAAAPLILAGEIAKPVGFVQHWPNS
jgi:hypothetical protein